MVWMVDQVEPVVKVSERCTNDWAINAYIGNSAVYQGRQSVHAKEMQASDSQNLSCENTELRWAAPWTQVGSLEVPHRGSPCRARSVISCLSISCSRAFSVQPQKRTVSRRFSSRFTGSYVHGISQLERWYAKRKPPTNPMTPP